MANSDKDIIITPNRGQSTDPKIEFSGATAGSSSTVTMYALPRSDGDGGLEIRSSAGESIAAFQELQTGSLFSVNDDAGLAKFEVNETGIINTSLNSGALGLPVGATTERPDVPQAGYTRWNSNTKSMEVYNGEEWLEVISDYFPSGSCHFGGD